MQRKQLKKETKRKPHTETQTHLHTLVYTHTHTSEMIYTYSLGILDENKDEAEECVLLCTEF